MTAGSETLWEIFVCEHSCDIHKCRLKVYYAKMWCDVLWAKGPFKMDWAK